MAKRLIPIISKTPPNETNVLWLDSSGDTMVPKIFNDGWESIAIGMGKEKLETLIQDISRTITDQEVNSIADSCTLNLTMEAQDAETPVNITWDEDNIKLVVAQYYANPSLPVYCKVNGVSTPILVIPQDNNYISLKITIAAPLRIILGENAGSLGTIQLSLFLIKHDDNISVNSASNSSVRPGDALVIPGNEESTGENNKVDLSEMITYIDFSDLEIYASSESTGYPIAGTSSYIHYADIINKIQHTNLGYKNRAVTIDIEGLLFELIFDGNLNIDTTNYRVSCKVLNKSTLTIHEASIMGDEIDNISTITIFESV